MVMGNSIMMGGKPISTNEVLLQDLLEWVFHKAKLFSDAKVKPVSIKCDVN